MLTRSAWTCLRPLRRGALSGIAAWLGATCRAVRRHDSLSALRIGLLPLVALSNALLVHRHAVGSLALAGAWALFRVVPTTLLAISVTTRQSLQRVVAVAGRALAVAVLVASNLVDLRVRQRRSPRPEQTP